jgi:hypothetical protein
MHLQFKCASCGKNKENKENARNIARCMENTPNFKYGHLVLYQGCRKKIRSKNKKKYIYFAESLLKLSAKIIFAESLGLGALGKENQKNKNSLPRAA